MTVHTHTCTHTQSGAHKHKYLHSVISALPGVYLATGVLVPETLTALHSLTQFENLMPRFTATVPPCWSEIQQEQQQRRHPQHLQQQGEATQHTRTWKLTQNGLVSCDLLGL